MRRLLIPFFFLLTTLTSLGALAARPRQAARPRPNVVLILVDDFGYECVGVNGSASYKTPNMDRLAESGARITHCYTPPLCTPTRVQLMTGRYNPRNYVQFGTLKKGERTFAHMLKAAGYATGIAGKWQLDEAGGQTPLEAGFDEYCLWNIYHEGEYVHGDRYADANLVFYDPQAKQETYRKVTGEYGPDVTTKYLLDFVERNARAKQPFFAYYPMALTHGPMEPTPKSEQWATGNRHEKNDRFFKDMVEYADVLVGQVVKKLDDLGVRDNTLVLLTGDNGTQAGMPSQLKDGKQVIGGKGRLTDAGTHEPLFASWPGTIRAGQVRDDLVDSTDFLPTIADATGAKLPQPPGDGVIDGRSFLPPLRGQKGKPRNWALIDYRAGRGGPGRNDGRWARDRRWKLYGFAQDNVPRDKSGNLYDLVADPDEAQPIHPGNAEADAARARLQKALDSVPAQKAEAAGAGINRVVE